jgi:hypothetical protein
MGSTGPTVYYHHAAMIIAAVSHLLALIHL